MGREAAGRVDWAPGTERSPGTAELSADLRGKIVRFALPSPLGALRGLDAV